MASYTARQVHEILGLSRGMITRLVESGFVKPARGPRREWHFSFQDLVVLRAAKGLRDAKLPARRISASLRKLRAQLPDRLPSRGLRIAAIGNALAVREGRDRWRNADGQYLLAFDVAAPHGELVVLDQPVGKTAEDWFREAARVEGKDPGRAIALYREALAARAHHDGIYANLGRLLHAAGELAEAAGVYREAIRRYPHDATLSFNFGVLLEDLGRPAQAIARYEEALEKDPRFADACYNLALLYEASGREKDAVRCFNAFRKLEDAR